MILGVLISCTSGGEIEQTGCQPGYRNGFSRLGDLPESVQRESMEKLPGGGRRENAKNQNHEISKVDEPDGPL
jgi:hypothetical protein